MSSAIRPPGKGSYLSPGPSPKRRGESGGAALVSIAAYTDSGDSPPDELPSPLRRGAGGEVIRLLLPAAFLPTLAAAGCATAPSQSALRPAGPASASITTLWWLPFGIATAVFVIVMGLLAVGVMARQERRTDGSLAEAAERSASARSLAFVAVGGAILPAIILIGVLFASLRTTVALRTPENAPLTVEVVGHQWWWEVRYPAEKIVTANEITIPAGSPVRLKLTSADVNHSFWVPSLNGKMDLIPGHPNIFWIAADKPGIYRGQCAEYCGLQHAHMAFLVIALPPDQYARWVAERQKPPPPLTNAALVRGRQVFTTAACKDCHTISGTGANGKVGPDLTHLASRKTIAAGLLPNETGALEGWIGDPQSNKPGAKMPRTYLAPADLHDVRAYLQTLR